MMGTFYRLFNSFSRTRFLGAFALGTLISIHLKCIEYASNAALALTQFRGFLEPPMEEGYLKKWRH